MRAVVHNPTFKTTLYIDGTWLKRQSEPLELSKLTFPAIPLTDFKLYDEKGEVVGTLHDVYRELLTTGSRKESGAHNKDFVEPIFVDTEHSVFSRIKLARIVVKVTFNAEEHFLGFMGLTSLVDLVLFDLDEGKIRLFRLPKVTSTNLSNHPHQPPDPRSSKSRRCYKEKPPTSAASRLGAISR